VKSTAWQIKSERLGWTSVAVFGDEVKNAGTRIDDRSTDDAGTEGGCDLVAGVGAEIVERGLTP